MSQKLESAIAVIGIDIGKKLVPRCRPRREWCHRAAAEVVAWPAGALAD
jgi:hypothetical protein